MTDAEHAIYDKALADAYDRGFAAGKEIGFDVGFLTAARASYDLHRKEDADGDRLNAGPTLPFTV